MDYSQTLKPVKLNLDKTPKALLPNESFYLLNHQVNNTSSLQKGTPLNANYLACDMEVPAGENYSVGRMYSELTNELYSWHYNSNGVHYIQRIKEDGECEIVYDGDCLVLSPEPRHEITNFRALLDVDYLCNVVPGGILKRLKWVDGTDTPMGCIDVEASIATNSFTTPFFDLCAAPCAAIQMCVPEPSGCLIGNWIPFSATDIGKSNRMLDKGLKFAYRDIYYDGRASELSDWSTLYYQDAKSCFDNSEGFSRCIKFRMPLGNPMVDRKEFYFSEDGGLTWFLSDVIEKYKKYNINQPYWYQRELTEEIRSTYDEDDCTFEYTFCNDKQRVPIDPNLLIREYNPIPREAQGMFRLKQSVAVYNYVTGTCPIDPLQVKKMDIVANCDSTTACKVEMVKVTVRAIIYSDVIPSETVPDATEGIGGYVFRAGGAENGAVDDVTDAAWFGTGFQILDQTFGESKARNFIAYVEGTDYWQEMEQYKSSPNFTGVKKKVGVLSGLQQVSTRKHLTTDILSGNFYYQEAILHVPKGMKGFIRLVSHHQSGGAGGNQDTSTSVVGALAANGLKSYNGNTQLSAMNLDANIKEIYFDTCNGDVDYFDAFVVKDETFNDDGGYSGYLKDGNGLPVEGAAIYLGDSKAATTDFNGFWSFHNNNGILGITVYTELDCGAFKNVGGFTANIDITSNQMGHFDYQIPSEEYKSKFYASVNVLVNNCQGQPVSGVHVSMSGSKYKITDSSGVAHFKVRNYESRARQMQVVIVDKANCFVLDCNGNCNPCMPTQIQLLQPCLMGTPPVYSITFTSSVDTENISVSKRGLKSGGRYPFGFIAEGNCGQLSSVNELKYIDIPRLQQTGNLGFCEFSYNTGGMVLPDWVKRIKIVRGVNVAPYYLQWIVDKIDRSVNGKIILTIQSLNDYNKQYNFKTNTVYEFLAGDRLEFIRNGDGVLFDLNTNGLLNYQILSPFNDQILSGVTNDVKFFNQLIIADNSKLDNLKEGAIIEIQGGTSNRDALTYFEICASVPVVNGIVQEPTGTFETFDTFLVNRKIASFAIQPFESKTPSDFWGGSSLDDLGKVHFVNRFENEQRRGRNITISAALQANYFGDFIKTLDAAVQGDIIAIGVKDDKIGLAICQNDSFIFVISDDLLRIGSDNVVRASPADSIISNPQTKLYGQFGVSYDDVGSVFFGDGFAFFCDERNSDAIVHNYRYAQKAALTVGKDGVNESSCTSFFTKRMRQKADVNRVSTGLDKFRYSVGQDVTTSIVFLTLKSLRHAGVNNEKAAYVQPNDTIMYNPESDSFAGFASFTPEGYGQLDLKTDEGCAFVTYQNGLPFIHPIITTQWNNFYGIPCDWVIGVTLNQFSEKVKIPLAIELQADKMFYASAVTTDKPTFLSEIPPKRAKQRNGKWNAAFLNDLNSRGGLFSGTRASGYYTNVVLVRDNTIDLQYNTIDNGKRGQYSEIDSILIKFMLSEQAGNSENL